MASTSQLVSQLQSEANNLQSSVNTQAKKVHVALDKIDTTVNNVAQRIQNLRKMIIEGEEKQQAHENVLRLEQQINEQLKSYISVRKSVLGFIKDFNINLVRNETAAQLSEELWMSSSRYWLSYAFIAISAWIKNDKEICENALQEALRRDFSKTSLFFCLFNLRLNRNIEAREWLYDYFGSIDSMHPPRNTALILRAHLYGVFGVDSQLDNFVRNTVDGWVTELNTNSTIATELVEKYNAYLCNQPTGKHSVSSELLSEHCETVAEMDEALNNAGRYRTVIKNLEKLDGASENPCDGDFIKKIDSLLEGLVTEPEEEELRLNNEKLLYEIIMKHEGDVEAAKKEYEEAKEKNKEDPNIGEQMFFWAAYPDKETDLSIQKFAVQKTKSWYMNAVKTYDHSIKSTAPGAFKLNIDLWQDTTDGKDREAIKNGLKTKFEREKSKLLVFTKANVVVTVIAAILLILGIVIGIAATPADWALYAFIAGPGLFVILFGIIVIKTVVAVKGYPKRIQKAQNTLDACLDAIDSYRKNFEEMTLVRDDILKKLEYI